MTPPELEKLKSRRADLLDQLDAINAKAVTDNDESRDLTEEEQKDWDALMDQIKALDRQIERVKFVHQERSTQAKKLPEDENLPRGPPGSTSITGGEKQRPKGTRLAACVRFLTEAKGNLWVAAQIARQADDHEIAKALGSGTGPQGGFLAPGEFFAEIIEFLRPASVVRASGARVVPLNGSLTMPRITGGASAEYIGENQDTPKTGMEFGQLNFVERLLAALVPVSNQLIRNATPDVDALIRDDLVRALAQREDKGFLADDGTGNKPLGLLHQADTGNKLNANGTVTIPNITVDAGKLMSRLLLADIMLNQLGWLMNPVVAQYLMDLRTSNEVYAFPEMQNGMFKGYPYRTTTQIPINLGSGNNESRLYLVNFGDVIIADAMRLELSISEEAAYMENGQLVSAFSRNQTVIKAVSAHDIGARHRKGIAVMEKVKWGTT